MGGVVAIPERACGWLIGKELTPLSSDVFISIPERVCVDVLCQVPMQSGYQYLAGSDIFDWLNKSST